MPISMDERLGEGWDAFAGGNEHNPGMICIMKPLCILGIIFR
ncbi:Hypothetical protein GbCGDNIH7_5074 [Granulibacter bethesdensis]|nr:Hypothetical protein GbCGDNIH7_5074 [Granulibacter bethesdensis]